MFGIIQSIFLSIIVILIGHFIYFSLFDVFLNEELSNEGRNIDFKKQNEEREKIMETWREEEREDEQLEEYLKTKLNGIKNN